MIVGGELSVIRPIVRMLDSPTLPPVSVVHLHRERLGIRRDRRSNRGQVERERDGVLNHLAVDQQFDIAHLHVVRGVDVDGYGTPLEHLEAGRDQIFVRGRRADRHGRRNALGVEGEVVEDGESGRAVGHEGDALADGDRLGRSRRVENGNDFIGDRGIGQIKQPDL